MPDQIAGAADSSAQAAANATGQAPPRGARFQRTQRLLRPRDFDRVFKLGRRSGGRLLSMLAAPAELPQGRIGFAIAKKAVPDAVQRNRIKRLLREHFRLHAEEAGAHDLVFMARPPAAEATREQLREAIQSCFRQLKSSSARR